MDLSQIWRTLPHDLAEQVFDHHINAHFFSDPAYTWTQLRQLSAHQKRVTELRFRTYWLPKLSITLYASASHRFDYGLGEDITQQATTTTTTTTTTSSLGDGSGDDGVVVFSMQRQVHSPLAGISQDLGLGRFMRKYLRKAWGRYDPATCRNVTVRLGEGVLSGGCRGGYVLNDTHLPGLELLEDGGIRFHWKGAVDELLREEMYMRKKGKKMFDDACEEWLANHFQDLLDTNEETHGFPPLNIQVWLWRSHVQAARRVAALNHRVAKSLGTVQPIHLKFRAMSKWLHGQEPDYEFINSIQRWLFVACSREQPPDIFEVAEVEESVVPMMEIFHTWVRQQPPTTDHRNNLGKNARTDMVRTHTIIDLYRREFAWRAWIRYSRREEQDDQEPGEDTEDEFINHEQKWTGLRALLLGDEQVRWVKSIW